MEGVSLSSSSGGRASKLRHGRARFGGAHNSVVGSSGGRASRFAMGPSGDRPSELRRGPMCRSVRQAALWAPSATERPQAPPMAERRDPSRAPPAAERRDLSRAPPAAGRLGKLHCGLLQRPGGRRPSSGRASRSIAGSSGGRASRSVAGSSGVRPGELRLSPSGGQEVTMILYEVLRLYPPAIFLSRGTYKEVEVCGIKYPAGVSLVLPIIYIHHDPNIWGEDAGKFNPERFADGISSATKHHQAAFFPFGGGPRICIGQNFALLQVKMALCTILQRFSFELSPSYTHAPHTVVTLQPQHGAPIRLKKL